MKKEENDVEIVLGGFICVIVMGAFLSIVFNYITKGSHGFESYFGLIFWTMIFSFIIIGIISLQSMMNNGSFEKTNKKIDELERKIKEIDWYTTRYICQQRKKEKYYEDYDEEILIDDEEDFEDELEEENEEQTNDR